VERRLPLRQIPLRATANPAASDGNCTDDNFTYDDPSETGRKTKMIVPKRFAA